jgi:hypothetical protein
MMNLQAAKILIDGGAKVSYSESFIQGILHTMSDLPQPSNGSRYYPLNIKQPLAVTFEILSNFLNGSFDLNKFGNELKEIIYLIIDLNPDYEAASWCFHPSFACNPFNPQRQFIKPHTSYLLDFLKGLIEKAQVLQLMNLIIFLISFLNLTKVQHSKANQNST